MEIKETNIEDVVEIQPRVFDDSRGYFFESYQKEKYTEALGCEFVQDNQSFSIKGVLRGLHFQKPPYAQAKLVSVSKGRVLDVAVDIRKGSPTFGQHVAVELDAQKNNMLFVPVGFAHGFVALEDCVFQYKCSNYYHKESESGLLWNDPVLNINWQVSDPLISNKDEILGAFSDLEDVF